MATISSIASGIWSNSSIWNSGTVPGIGDTVTVYHNISVVSNTTIGISPGNDSVYKALNVFSNSTLTVSNNISFFSRGDVYCFDGIIKIKSGSKFLFDNSANTAASYFLDLRCATGNSNDRTRLILEGTSSNKAYFGAIANSHCTIYAGSKSTGSMVRDGGLVQANNAVIQNVGNSSVRVLEYWAGTGYNQWYFRNTVFDGCGEFNAGGLYLDTMSGIDFYKCTWKNTKSEYSMYLNCDVDLNKTSYPNLIKRIESCVFDAKLRINTVGFEVSNIVSQKYSEVYLRYSVYPETQLLSNSFFIEDSSVTSPINFSYGSSIKENAFIWNNSANWINSILFFPTYTTELENTEFKNNVIGVLGSGQYITLIKCLPQYLSSTVDQSTINIANNVFLPDGGSYGFERWLQLDQYNTNYSGLYVDNNTVYGASISIGESSYWANNTIKSLKNNLYWDSSSRNYLLKDIGTNDTQTNFVLASNIKNNDTYNASTGTCTVSGSPQSTVAYSALEFSAATLPDATDLHLDPSFVDSTRTILTWDVSLGGSGTWSSVTEKICKLNDEDFDDRYSVQNFIAYIREGYRPTNESLRNAGYNNGHIGAVDLERIPNRRPKAFYFKFY